MARRVEYLCDACGRLFGDQTHLNIKNGDLRVSYKNANGYWAQKKSAIPCSEFHFCNEECLHIWLGGYIGKAMEASQPPQPQKEEA
jgi:hypothetical protein